MKIFRFDRETGKVIEHYNSSGFTLTRVARLLEKAMIQYACLEPDGLIGYHQATVPQLFLVVQGNGMRPRYRNRNDRHHRGCPF